MPLVIFLSFRIFLSFLSFLPFSVAFPRFFNNIRIPSLLDVPIEYQNFYSSTPAFYPRRRPIKRLYRRNKPPPIRIFRGVSRRMRQGLSNLLETRGRQFTIKDHQRYQWWIAGTYELYSAWQAWKLLAMYNYFSLNSRRNECIYIYISFNKFQEFKDRRVHVFVILRSSWNLNSYLTLKQVINVVLGGT